MNGWAIAGIVLLLIAAAVVFGALRLKADRDEMTLDILADEMPAEEWQELKKQYGR